MCQHFNADADFEHNLDPQIFCDAFGVNMALKLCVLTCNLLIALQVHATLACLSLGVRGEQQLPLPRVVTPSDFLFLCPGVSV